MNISPTPSLNASQFAYEGKDPEKINETAKKFTSLFYTQIVSEMMKEQDVEFGEEMFHSVFAEFVAEELSSSEAGQAMIETISQQLLQLQEGNNKRPAHSTVVSGENK